MQHATDQRDLSSQYLSDFKLIPSQNETSANLHILK